MNEDKIEYIPIEDAMAELQVTRDTWRYWRVHFGFEHKKFPLDRRKYISKADFERLKAALTAKLEKKQAIEHRQPGFLGQLAEAVNSFPADEQEEMERFFVETLAANPQMRLLLEEHHITLTGLQPRVTVEHSNTSEPVTLPVDVKQRV